MNMSISRKFPCVLLCLIFGAALCGAQTITTADTFFSSVSDAYAKITDFSANIEIVSASGSKSQSMRGRSVFKAPNLLRIDFSDPDEQTIVFNGDLLTIYLPTYNVVLTQSVDGTSTSSGASLATPEGLSLMKRYYTIAYEIGPSPVPLEENSKETVVVLALARRYTTEMFRTIRLMISPESNLIRRIEAVTVTGDKIVFNFTGYSLNQGILDNRFLYESPASANVFNDFLFNEE
jgi:outer membrane lipoprotein carrier protein